VEDRSTLFLIFWASAFLTIQAFAVLLLVDREFRQDFARDITRSRAHPLHRPLMLGQEPDEIANEEILVVTAVAALILGAVVVAFWAWGLFSSSPGL
jgi:hypothetical protein